MGNGQAASRHDGYSKLVASEQQKPQQAELHHDNVLGLADFEERLAPRQDAAAHLWCRGRGGGSWKQRLLVMGAWAAFVVVSALLVAVSVLFSLALYRYVNQEHPEYPFHTEIVKYSIGPIELGPGISEFKWEGVARPAQDALLLNFAFAVVSAIGGPGRSNSNNNAKSNISLEVLYTDHIFLAQTSAAEAEVMAAIGPEGNFGEIKLPRSERTIFAINSPKQYEWTLWCKLVNMWGMASGANLSVYVTYQVTYAPLSAEVTSHLSSGLIRLVKWDLLGSNATIDGNNRDHGAHFSVPGNGGPGSVFKYEREATWDKSDTAMIVFAWGYMGLGALNISLFANSSSTHNTLMEVEVAKSAAVYSQDRYWLMDVRPRDAPMHLLHRGDSYRITAFYDNSRAYPRATALLQIYHTTNATTTTTTTTSTAASSSSP